MRALICVLTVFFVATVTSRKLTSANNGWLQGRCGYYNPAEEMWFSHEFNERVMLNWAVKIYSEYLTIVDGTEMAVTTMAPGAILTPFHILTVNSIKHVNESLSLTNMETNIKNFSCDGNHLIVPEQFYPSFDYDLEWYRKFNRSRVFENEVVRITVLDGCTELTPTNLMVLEMKKSVLKPPSTAHHSFKSIVYPVCVANSTAIWWSLDAHYGYHLSEGKFAADAFKPVKCETDGPYLCAKMDESGPCKMMRGTIVVRRYSFASQLLGVSFDCQTDSAGNNIYRFLDLTHHMEMICEVTGNCVTPDVPTTTSPSTTSTSASNATMPATDESTVSDVEEKK
ncbi:hypothetical protein GCK72_022344 [Caenorhabditis remanei]|uniref:Uncharacterized protein n=1 Tax=Caenorhabditis remanei TaxID=31234 RepID=A0A6A5FTI2_CAERE|nr:hypothetical protein GCK72_022344 [Caenorhabditis remanei]KAF1745897.1 hypothetical protein GCK72_022344 [Caenorhabditis remanei]